MAKYLISFPSAAMRLSPEALEAADDAAHGVVREAKAAGVWIFGGGIDESVAPVLVGSDGSVSPGTYPQTARLEGGYCVLDLQSRREAIARATRIAAACGCAQELRVFQDDPES